jgi:Mg-chelatase subunit ChlD
VFQNVHISMVLDRSGSMDACRHEAVQTINAYFSHLRRDDDLVARMSVVLFDSESIDTIRDREPVSTCPDITLGDYVPRGGTPLLDAVGYSVGLLDCLSYKSERRILAIMTDGLDNASREYSRSRVFDLLMRKQREEGWLVLYFGANHDSWNQANQIGIESSHAANFSPMQAIETADVLHAVGKRYMAAESGPPARNASRLTPGERLSLGGGHRSVAQRTLCSPVAQS